MTNQMPVGVFDSGVGGISVLKELVRLLPNEDFYYYGDSANAPYGTRSTEEVRRLTEKAAAHLLEKGCKALVIACNTATSAAISSLRCAYPDTVIVGIEPALKPAADDFPGGTVGIAATAVTLREDKLQAQIRRFASSVRIEKIPLPGLVELVECGKADSPECISLLEKHLSPYAGRLDGLVLGCTHYPFAAASLRQVLPGVKLYDGGEGTAKQTARLLASAGLLNSRGGKVTIEAGSPFSDALCKKLLSSK